MKKVWGFTLAAALVISMLAGCGAQKQAEEKRIQQRRHRHRRKRKALHKRKTLHQLRQKKMRRR